MLRSSTSFLPRPCGCRLLVPLSPGSQSTTIKSQMTPLSVPQANALPRPTPPVPARISVRSTSLSCSLHRRSYRAHRPLRAGGARARRTASGAVACLSGASAEASTSGEEFVKKAASSGGIVVFSKSWCPYCATVKSIFKQANKNFSVIELDQREDGQEIQDALAKLVARRTVPQVFIKGEHIGGCDDTMAAYQSGKLANLLADLP